MVLGLESTQARMHRMARHELYLGDHIPVEQTMKAIDKVSVSDLQGVAQEVFTPDNLAVSIVGPIAPDIFDRVRWDKIRPRRTRRRKAA
jgi:predicted Zn-dependent peptidase